MTASLMSRAFCRAINRNLFVSNVSNVSCRLSSSVEVKDYPKYETIALKQNDNHVLHVELNRPKVNALSLKMFDEIGDCFTRVDKDKHIRAVVLTGNGKMFTGGLDLMSFQEIFVGAEQKEVSRKAFEIGELLQKMQTSMLSVGQCRKPIITAIHSACIGAGIDLISATDVRYCSQDAWFSIREVEIGLAADMGTLQYFPLIIGNDSVFRELVFTGRNMDSKEAKEIGLIGKVLPDFEAAKKAAFDTANTIARKSPIAVQGSKFCMNHSRDHAVVDGLKFMKVWNMSMLQSEDVPKAGMAVATKSEAPSYDDL